MQQEKIQVWRSLLQLAQATYAVLEREIPDCEGLPTNGLAVLRFLRWHGGKTLSAIAIFVGVSTALMEETISEMVRMGFIRGAKESDGETQGVFELAPEGVAVAKRINASQRDRIEQAIARLPGGNLEEASALLAGLAYELVADSTGFGISCAECWALDTQECVKAGAEECCAFRKAQVAELDPDLSQGPDDCPVACASCAPQFISLGGDSETSP